MKFILGTKQRMTQIFDEDGTVHAATIVCAMPLTITAFKGGEEDGYTSVQVGAGVKNKKNILKAQQGQFGKYGDFREIMEVRDIETGELKMGDTVAVDTFEIGDIVQVSATSKAKGFQGVVKRHGFKGGR